MSLAALMEARSRQSGGPRVLGSQARNEPCCSISCLPVLGDYLMGYLIKGKKVLWAGLIASRKGGIYSVLTTFYKNREVMGPRRPRPRADLPGGRVVWSGWMPFREELLLPAGMGKAVVGVFHGEGNLISKRGSKHIKLFFLKQKQL